MADAIVKPVKMAIIKKFRIKSFKKTKPLVSARGNKSGLPANVAGIDSLTRQSLSFELPQLASENFGDSGLAPVKRFTALRALPKPVSLTKLCILSLARVIAPPVRPSPTFIAEPKKLFTEEAAILPLGLPGTSARGLDETPWFTPFRDTIPFLKTVGKIISFYIKYLVDKIIRVYYNRT